MMALTAAEKMRRYRQKIKDNPERYEEQKKDKERIKIKRKKISQLGDAEKSKIRKQWRDQKKKQRKKKNGNDTRNEDVVAQDTNSNSSKENNRKTQETDSSLKAKLKYMKKKYYILSKKLEQSQKNEESLQKIREKLKKRLYRQKKASETEIKNLKSTVEKMKARDEVLEASLKTTYKNCKKRAEKKVLRRIIENAKVKTFVAKLMGLSGRNKYKKKTTPNGRIREIESFFIKDDVSRCTAGKKECRTKNKKKYQIRYLNDTLINLYQKYRSEGGRYKFTAFRKYKPFYVLAPHLASRDTCLCVKHDNIQLKFKALKQKGLIEHQQIKDVLEELSCDVKSPLCMHGKCRKCRNKALQFKPNVDLDETITWNQWERKKHEYSKKEGTENKTFVCIKTEKVKNTCTLGELLRIFEADLKLFKKHHFNCHHQQEKYQEGVTNLKENEALVICDFSQNYESKLSSEIQSMHFGASKCQISLHTGMVYFKNKAQSFCTVSPSTIHQPQAIWAHLKPVLEYIEELQPQVTTIHFYSDGPTSQYRQKNNFYLLSVFRQKLNMDYCTWSFFESGHGKGVADGIGGTVKRLLDRNVCFGRDISNASDAFEILRENLNTIKVWYISEKDIEEVAALLPQKLSTVVGTMQLHQISTQQPGIIAYRDLGCFCGSQRGLCTCHEPKTHKFEEARAQSKSNTTTKNTAIEATVTLDDIDESDLMNLDVEVNLEELSAMDNMNFSSIGNLENPDETILVTENVDVHFSVIGDTTNLSEMNPLMDKVKTSSSKNSDEPNIGKSDLKIVDVNQNESSMDEVKNTPNKNTGNVINIYPDDSLIVDMNSSTIGNIISLNNSEELNEIRYNTMPIKDEICLKEPTAIDSPKIAKNNFTTNVKPNVLETDIILDQPTISAETSIEETTVMNSHHIPSGHPASNKNTNVSQADSLADKLITTRKNACTVDLTVDPLEMKLTCKAKKRPNCSVLIVSQPKVKKGSAEERNLKNYNDPCTSKSLSKSSVAILSNISIKSKPETRKNTSLKQSKGLKTVVKRAFTCYNCNGPLVSNSITKCMSCCNRFCLDCCTGEVIKDYICDNCRM